MDIGASLKIPDVAGVLYYTLDNPGVASLPSRDRPASVANNKEQKWHMR